MGKMTRDEITSFLQRQGSKIDVASQYASAFLEYQEASENIERNGSVTIHPKTAGIIQNPYIKIRDSAEKRLQNLRRPVGISAVESLWSQWSQP